MLYGGCMGPHEPVMVLRLSNDGVKYKASAQYVKYVSIIRIAEYAGRRFAHSLTACQGIFNAVS